MHVLIFGGVGIAGLSASAMYFLAQGDEEVNEAKRALRLVTGCAVGLFVLQAIGLV